MHENPNRYYEGLYRLDNVTQVIWCLHRAKAIPAATRTAAAKELALLEAAPVNRGLVGEVADGEAVGTIGDPVAEGVPAFDPVLPAVTAAVPVAKPEEPAEMPVELPFMLVLSIWSTCALAAHLMWAVFVQEQALS